MESMKFKAAVDIRDHQVQVPHLTKARLREVNQLAKSHKETVLTALYSEKTKLGTLRVNCNLEMLKNCI